MRYLIIFALIAASFTGCTKTNVREYQEICQRVDSEEMTRLVITYAVELEHKYHLNLEKSRFFYDEKIKKVRLDFSSQNVVELCEAREQLVDIIDGYLKRINEHVVLRSELESYPFTPKELEVHITYESYFVAYVDPMYVSCVIQEGGTSFFYNGELEEPHSDIWSQKVEPYAKTQQFVYFRREAEVPYIEAEKEKERQSYLKEERFIN